MTDVEQIPVDADNVPSDARLFLTMLAWMGLRFTALVATVIVCVGGLFKALEWLFGR